MSGWADYGFPNPELYPPLTPVTGIIEALNERRSAVGLSGMQIPERFSGIPNISRAFMIEFDSILAATTGYYINPDKYDPSTMTHIDQLRWNYTDLRDAAAGGYANRVEPIDPYPWFFPEWPAAWLKQVKKMIDLMRYPVIQADYLLKYGQTEPLAGEPTKIAAYNYAINDLHQVTNFDYFTSQFNGASGGGWGLWSTSIFQLDYVSPILPTGISDAWMTTYLDFPGVFDVFGLGLVRGFNRVKANNGYFIRRSNNIPYPQEWESPNYYYYAGFIGYSGPNHSNMGAPPLYYADYYPIFTFKEVSA